MKRLLAAVIAALCFSGAASADTAYYVKPTGTNSASGGTTFATAWRTLEYALTNAVAPNTANGDVTIHLYGNLVDNTPGLDLTPTNTPTDGKRLRIINYALTGFANAKIRGGSVSKSYITFHGITFNGPVTFDSTATRDSIRNCVVPGVAIHGDYNVIYKNTITVTGNSNQAINIGYGAGVRAVSNVIDENTISLGRGHAQSGQGYFVTGGGSTPSVCESLIVRNNVADMWLENSSAIDFPAMAHYKTQHSTWNYNKWRIYDYRPTGSYDLVRKFRNQTYNTVWNADSMWVYGTNDSKVWLTQCCDSNDEPGGQVRNWNIDSSFVWIQSGGTYFYSGMRFVRMTRSTFVSGTGTALTVQDSVVGANVIDHCTFVGKNATGSATGTGRALYTYDTNNMWATAATCSIGSSIMATVDLVPTVGSCNSYPCAPSGMWNANAPVVWPASAKNKIKVNFNLYYVCKYDDAEGDLAVAYYDGQRLCSAVGNGTAWEAWRASAVSTQDSASVFGDPLFAEGGANGSPYPWDPTFYAGAGVGSPAIGADRVGGTIGAVEHVDAPTLVITQGNEFDFSSLPPYMTSTYTIEYRNDSDAEDMNISDVATTADGVSSLTIVDDTVAAGATGKITFVYTAPSTLAGVTRDKAITFATNDPLRPTVTIVVRTRETTVTEEE